LQPSKMGARQGNQGSTPWPWRTSTTAQAMREFVSIPAFVSWLLKYCDEPFPMAAFEEDFEGCLWMPLDYLADLLSPAAITDLIDRVKVLDEIQIGTQQQ